MDLEALESHFSLLFFSFTSIFLVFTLLLQLLRSWPWWCNCPVCEAYVTSSWRADFDNLCDWYTHLLRQSPTRTIHIHVLCNTITADPGNVEHVLKSRFDNYPKGKPFTSILGDFLGRGIFNVDGDLWRFQRMLSSAELCSMSVRSFSFRVVSSEVRRRLLPLLHSAAGNGQVLDFQDVFRRFAFDNICRISFGLDPGCLELSLPMSEFAAAFDTASRLSARRAAATVPALWKAKRLLNLGSERELRRAIRHLDLLAEEVVRQRRKLGFSTSHDLLSRFMASVDDDRYLRDIVISFMLAGRDTVSSALTSFFMLLSRHPAVQSKIRSEIEKVTGSCGGDGGAAIASYDQLRQMHYVHAALYESMRLYPPVQFNSKFSVDDDILPDGTFISSGTRVTYHAYAMGRMEALWGTDSREFRPERWLKNGVFACENPFKYPVFQGGLRACLGREMAMMEMKTVIASVVRGFEVNMVDESRPPKFSPGLTATMEGGLPVRVRWRKYKEVSTASQPELWHGAYYQYYSYARIC